MTAERVEEKTAEQSVAESTDTAAQTADTTDRPADLSQPDSVPDQAAAEAGGEAPAGTADPSPEAAIGASGARPLGDAEEVAAKASAAVEEMADRPVEARADAPAEEQPADDAQPEQPTADAQAVDAQAEQPAAPAQPEQSTAAAQAVDAQAEQPAAGAQAVDAPAEQPAADAAEAPAAEAAATDAPAEQPAAPSDTAATDAPAEQPAPPARPPVPEGPEPTTMEELLNEQPGEIRSLKHGDVVEGTVVRIDKDEILVDIGAKSEGVVSNRELYGRNAEVQPTLNIGDTVLVYVLQPESPEGHAVLSLRRAGLERKWRAMQEQLDAGTIIEAPVIDHNKGGLIVDCGIRGFVPISQIVDFPRRPQNEQPRDAAQEIAEKLQPYVGRKLRLKILEVNRKANRLILSEKVALYEERREKRDELFSSLQVGQKVTGTVRSIAPFGVFIDLGGIDGLVHKSELSWNKVNNPEAGYKIGDEVEAEVIDINHERGRISLSIRRLQPDPWHSSVADLKVGDLLDGTVTKIVNFGAFVRVRDGLEGLIHISELSHQRVVHPGDVVHEGQRLKLKVISLDSERHRLGLSLKQAEEEPAPRTEQRERRPRQERGGYDSSQAVQEPEGGIDNTLAAAFAQVRQQMEQTEAARRTGDTEPTAEAEPTAEGQPTGEAQQTAEGAEQAAEAPPAAEPTAAEEPSEVLAETAAEAKPGDVVAAPGEASALDVGSGEPATEAEPEPAPASAAAEPESAPASAAAESQPEPPAAGAEPPSAEEPPAAAEPPTADEPPAAGTAEPAAEASAEAAQPETSQAEGSGEAAPDEGADKGDEEDDASAPARRGRAKKGAESGAPVADTSGEPAEGSVGAAPAEGADKAEPAAD